jgi:hypothetical protein
MRVHPSFAVLVRPFAAALLGWLLVSSFACVAVPSGPPSLALLSTDVSSLSEVPSPSNRRQWESGKAQALRDFDAIQLEHVDVSFLGSDPGPLGAIDASRIETTFRERVIVRLREAGIEIAPAAGPRVLQLRLRLAGMRYGERVRASGGGQTLRRQIRLQTLGIEGVFRDGETGKLAAVILTRPRGATSVAERWSEMEDVLDLFAKNFARDVAAERAKKP